MRRLSGSPSQSLSSLELQSRTSGNTAPTQGPNWLSTHVLSPREQRPAVVSGPQPIVCPVSQMQGGLLWEIPSQSASPIGSSQSSCGFGPIDPWHSLHSFVLAALATHSRRPARQSPTLSNRGCSSHGSVAPSVQTWTAGSSGRGGCEEFPLPKGSDVPPSSPCLGCPIAPGDPDGVGSIGPRTPKSGSTAQDVNSGQLVEKTTMTPCIRDFITHRLPSRFAARNGQFL